MRAAGTGPSRRRYLDQATAKKRQTALHMAAGKKFASVVDFLVRAPGCAAASPVDAQGEHVIAEQGSATIYCTVLKSPKF